MKSTFFLNVKEYLVNTLLHLVAIKTTLTIALTRFWGNKMMSCASTNNIIYQEHVTYIFEPTF